MIQNATVIVAHAAWADSSSWAEIIRLLYAHGIKSISAPLPLTSLTDDIRALDRVIDRTSGPVVLGGHAYSGAVVSGTQNPRVRATIHVAGLTPAEGESVMQVFTREKPHPKAPQLAPDADGVIFLPDEAFPAAFAQNATKEQLAVIAATQRPLSMPCIQQPSPMPSWTRKPAWYLINEEDRMIPVATQRYLAERMKAKIHSERVDHLPLVTAPDKVFAVFEEALQQAD